MPVEFKDYYQTLGVPKDASPEQIKRAFRKLAVQYHPDKATGNKKRAEEKFKEINEAYEVLGDPEKRRKYDQLGAGWQQHGGIPPGWEEFRVPRGAGGPGGGFEFHFDGTGFSDFFEQFFGGGHGRGGFSGFDGFDFGFGPQAARVETQRGADIEGDILVTLEEALHGSTRDVTVQRADPRTGRAETQTCRVRIPPGVREGQLIRLAGRGQEGLGDGAAGDLYLRVKFANHPDFRVRNADVYYDLPLAPWEAVLGAHVTVPTLDGAVSLRIAPGTPAGRQLRLAGKGLPHQDGGRGDMYVVVSVQVPERATAREQKLWEELARESGFNPRRT
ncbi:MAG: J domain-containing protein [Verrucomicrobia bacterium]|nr:J domain-containing protein [Verrucomicrobiota bacterium]